MTNIISGANFNQDATVKGTSINYKENKTNEKTSGVADTFAGVVIAGGVQCTGDNTYESLIKEADDVKGQIMASASGAKLGLKALMMKLSGADAVKIDEDGFNLTDATDDDMVNIIDKIKIELAMHCEDYVSFGIGVSKEQIESVTGSAGLANSIESRMSDANVAVNDESIAEVKDALLKAGELKPLTENTMNYMVANNVEPTIAGIYQAQAASRSGLAVSLAGGRNSGTGISDADFEALKPGIGKILADAGLEVNDKNYDNARAFIDNQIPVTEQTLRYKAQLDSMDMGSLQDNMDYVLDKILDNMKLGGKAWQTSLVESPVDDIITALDTLDKAEYSDVASVIAKGNTFTIASLKLEIDARVFNPDCTGAVQPEEVQPEEGEINNSLPETDGEQPDIDKAYNTLVETRIMMSASASVFLVKNNVPILTTPMDELNGILKSYEMADGMYDEAGIPYETVLEIRKAFDQMVRNPERVFANMFDRAANTYEAVGTQVRSDLGDSLKKAVNGSAEDIIKELGLEGTREDREAVKVLAANSMEMTNENIDRVKTVNAMLNNLIKNMKPETVLNMIKDGVNPMNASIEEVNEYLAAMNQNASRDNEEKFSKFLYKLDRTGGITKEQRKQFIGIYQMMNIFTKDAGVAAGALVKQGVRITMSSLMSAYNSRKHYGMERTVDDTTGMSEVRGTVNYYSALFSTNGALVTPNTLKNVDNTTGIGGQSVENFIEQLEAVYDEKAEAEYYEEYLEAQAAAADAGAGVLREIRRSELDVNTGNVQAVKAFLESGQFPDIRGRKTTKDYARESIEQIGHKEKLSLMFDEMEDEVQQELQEAISQAGDLDTELDLNYEEFLDLRMKERTIGYIKNLAVRHDYRIPYATSQGDVGMINLTLVQDEEQKGRISVKMQSETFGKISVEARADEDNMNIFVVTDRELAQDAEYAIDDMAEALRSEFGLKNVEVYTGKSDDVPYINYEKAADSIATDRLYEMAGVIVRALAG